MATLVPVDHDPFATPAPRARLVPVQRDPFAASAPTPPSTDLTNPETGDFLEPPSGPQNGVQSFGSELARSLTAGTPGAVLQGIGAAAEAGGEAAPIEMGQEPGASGPFAHPIYQTGSAPPPACTSAYPTPPGVDESLPGRIAATAGALPWYVAGGAPGAAVIGGTSAAGGSAERAQQAGATPEQALAAAGGDAVIGAAGAALPIESVLRPILRDAPGLMPAAIAAVNNPIRSGAIGATSPAAMQFASNWIAQQTYAPGQRLGEGVPEAAVTGAAVFGGIGGLRGATAPVGRVVNPSEPMAAPGRVDLSGEGGPIVDNGPGAPPAAARRPQAPPPSAPPPSRARRPRLAS